MQRTPISFKQTAAQLPFSAGIIAEGKFAFISGQGPFDPATGQLAGESFEEQAHQVFRNISTLLEIAGTGWEHVVKVNVYLADREDFRKLNAVYETYIKAPYPARTTVEVGMVVDMLIEVDCIALIPA